MTGKPFGGRLIHRRSLSRVILSGATEAAVCGQAVAVTAGEERSRRTPWKVRVTWTRAMRTVSTSVCGFRKSCFEL